MFIDARACVYALHRARPSEHYTAACPGLLHSIRDIPHSSHTCTNASVEVPRIPVVDTQASRHDTDADAAPFMGQGNIRTVYGTGESSAFCAVGSTLLWKSRFPAPFLRRIERSALRYFALLPLGERFFSRKRDEIQEDAEGVRSCMCVYVCVCLGRKKGAIEGCSIVYVVSQWALLNV